MPDYSVLYPGRFMKKEALEHPKVIRITDVKQIVLEGEKGAEGKVVLYYKAADGIGEIVWNKTNAELTWHALGERVTEKWVGRLLTIYNNPNVDLAGKKVGGIRVYGSPEMAAAKTVEVKRPRRKKPEVYPLTPTDMKGNATATGAKVAKPPQATTPVAPAPVDELDADSPPDEHWAAVEAEAV
jgi:hypothetical protein